MARSHRTIDYVLFLVAICALLLAVACSSSGDEANEAAFPSRDWSGPYALEATESSTDCAGSEAPPPLTDAILDVRQSPDNAVLARIPPLVEMQGSFDGDRLTAGGAIRQPIPLPDSIAGRATPEDSLDTIAYTLEVAFDGDGLTGRYAIRAPDLNALSAGSGAGRCEYVYEVRGRPLIGDRSPGGERPAEFQ